MGYLRDMHDLSLAQAGAAPTDALGAVVGTGGAGAGTRSRRPTGVERTLSDHSLVSAASSDAPSTLSIAGAGQLRSRESIARLRSGTASATVSVATTDSNGSSELGPRKFKDDKAKRAAVVREIVETERTYVKGLHELVEIYIKPASLPTGALTGASSRETVVPAAERKVVFGGIEALFTFHEQSFLPALERAAGPLLQPPAQVAAADAGGQLSLQGATAVANTFVAHAAFMKMYSTYINNFDNSVQRIKSWSSERAPPAPATAPSTPAVGSTANLVGLGLTMSAVSTPGVVAEGGAATQARLTSNQRKRIKTWQKRCRLNPRHSQLNLEGYLLLPVQRVPRYRLLLEELVRSTPPTGGGFIEDPLDKALQEISSLATNMNEGKREAESRSKLVQWQSRIKGSSKFPSPLVQPHRRLIMDGPLLLTRVVRKKTVLYEVFNAQGDASTVTVDCLAPELTPRPLIGVLCNDLLVLCRDTSEGRDPGAMVDLWAVLRMQTVPQPASIVHGNVLRIVDNKAVLYFDAPSASDALNWYRAINIHIPSSKS